MHQHRDLGDGSPHFRSTSARRSQYLNTVSGAGEVGGWPVEHADIDKITFTGSTATGTRIAAKAAKKMVPTTMELGGNDATIVLPGAGPKAIAAGPFWGAFIHMGQTCACAKHLHVHEPLHDEVAAELKALADVMPMGEPGNFFPATLITDIADGAPLIDEEQFGPVLPIIKYRCRGRHCQRESS